MFLLNFTNRSDTDAYFPLYEILYIVECLFLLADICICPTIAYALLSTTALHLNTRLMLASATSVGFIAGLARLALIHYQYFGDAFVSRTVVILSSLARVQCMAYFCGILPVLAVDRLIATTNWKWYESQHWTTLFIFFIAESLLIIFSLSGACLVVFEFVTDTSLLITILVVAVVGVILFIILHIVNVREVASLKNGAQINRYSVARSYQFRDNVAITKYFFRLSIPLMICLVPVFSCYILKASLVRNEHLKWLRIFAIEMFDLWIGITMVIVAPGVVIYEPRVQQSLRKLRIFGREVFRNAEVSIEIKYSQEAYASVYFSMLSRDLDLRNSIPQR